MSLNVSKMTRCIGMKVIIEMQIEFYQNNGFGIFLWMSFDWLMFFCSFQAEYFIISNFSWLLFIILFPLFFISEFKL